MSISPLNITAAGDSGSYTSAQASTTTKPDPVVSTVAPAATPQSQRATEGDVANAIEKLNDFASKNASAITFSKDQDSGKTVIKVIDTSDNTVLRQIPSQEAIEIAKSIDKLQGLLINHKV